MSNQLIPIKNPTNSTNKPAVYTALANAAKMARSANIPMTGLIEMYDSIKKKSRTIQYRTIGDILSVAPDILEKNSLGYGYNVLEEKLFENVGAVSKTFMLIKLEFYYYSLIDNSEIKSVRYEQVDILDKGGNGFVTTYSCALRDWMMATLGIASFDPRADRMYKLQEEITKKLPQGQSNTTSLTSDDIYKNLKELIQTAKSEVELNHIAHQFKKCIKENNVPSDTLSLCQDEYKQKLQELRHA